jgi:acetoin utilization deacetylase AcuC-like enzyme
MVLIDHKTGVLSKSQWLKHRANFEIRETTTEASLADVLRVHDFRYIQTIKQKCLEAEMIGDLVKYDRDSTMSSESWKAALLSSGAIIEACDSIMGGHYKNAFCAIRPPGHHAGVFGKTFKNNECD